MSKYKIRITLALITTLLSGCQMFQTIDTPAEQTPPTAQEVLKDALTNLYTMDSGTFIQNYHLTLSHDDQDYDEWTINAHQNWKTTPPQSLSDIHIAFTLPAPISTGQIAQGLINLNIATTKHERFVELNSANFSGTDGHVLDDVLKPWTNQWFSVPSNLLANNSFSWLLETPQLIESVPQDTITNTEYFNILTATSVQTSDEEATLFAVSLKQGEILNLLAAMKNASPSLTTEIDSLRHLIEASTFKGTLLVGNASKQLKKIDGVITVQSANEQAQQLTMTVNIEITNINENPPVAIPTGASTLPPELFSPNSVLQ